uniref:Tyrosine-protein kinase n=1 Tax=Ephydatia fluviatilis TaxID=31330 RepID=Q9Y1X9_9METZ|nr:protein tyrosine kinase [Ephydatia fluviatilis]
MTDLSKELWYHGRISRLDAEQLLDNFGRLSGSFLVRDSLTTTGEYVLSLSFQGKKYHYIISRHPDGSVAIQDGAKFDSPIELIQYHTKKVDGLITTLKQPCCRLPGQPPQGYRFISHEEMQMAMREAALLLGYQEHQVKDALVKRRSAFEQLVGGILHRKQLWFHGAISREESEQRMKAFGLRDGLFLVRERTEVNSFALCVAVKNDIYHYLLEMNTLGQLSIENGRKFENLLQVVDHYSRTPDGLLCTLVDVCAVTRFEAQAVPMPGAVVKRVKHGPRRIEDSELSTQGELGAGTFGTVRLGVYRPKNGEPEVQCALKYLKQSEELPNQKAEILREADAMAALDHCNIVRLFGICVGDPICLVMELARQGPLNKFLRKRPTFPVIKILNMALQVSRGMAYLEEVRFVHRDLAARNVLVVDDDNVKISDFGMSRAIGAGSEYYKAETAGRWPLKWYAPECIYYAKFDSKSDVWSYGVTVWEAFSFGAKPYAGLKGQDIMQMLEGNQRLDSPEKCPQPIYDIMLRCWAWRPEDRPSFSELSSMLKDIYVYLQQNDTVVSNDLKKPLPPKPLRKN